MWFYFLFFIFLLCFSIVSSCDYCGYVFCGFYVFNCVVLWSIAFAIFYFSKVELETRIKTKSAFKFTLNADFILTNFSKVANFGKVIKSLFRYFYFQDFITRTNQVNNFQSFNYLAKAGVLTIQMRSILP